MSGDTQDQKISPLPRFYFSVDIGDQKDLAFQEVSGLETESKAGNVTLKKGVFARDSKFWRWYSQVSMNTIKRVPVVIKLLDEKGNSTMVWTLQNAWPTKITGTDLKADSNEVAVETLEIAHEGLIFANS
ncbi:conserved hypothetical phage tail region protein [Burkholderia sp. GAS332]|jgi:phage tail-like protein|uniref:phage tail protein n=1 Tax=Paraburkholderia sp. TaxID=1926495 RepID=UPI00092AA35A|nr:conserved hypothetical phage tail region protein [Burkholderia sp. GAS332]